MTADREHKQDVIVFLMHCSLHYNCN